METDCFPGGAEFLFLIFGQFSLGVLRKNFLLSALSMYFGVLQSDYTYVKLSSNKFVVQGNLRFGPFGWSLSFRKFQYSYICRRSQIVPLKEKREQQRMKETDSEIKRYRETETQEELSKNNT